MQTLVLQPQNWSVLGGSQPARLWRSSASPAAVCPHTPLLTTQPETNSGWIGWLQGGRKDPKEAAGHFRTCPTGLCSSIFTKYLGAAQPGNVSATEQQHMLQWDSPRKAVSQSFRKDFFFLVAFNFILHCVFYCLLAAISKFIISP